MNTDFFDSNQTTPVENISFLNSSGNTVNLSIKRDDLIDPEISGNKWRKLKHNFFQLKQSNFKGIASFGGAFSNHIAALSAAGNRANIPTLGFVRTHALDPCNPTLQLAQKNGMNLVALSREEYKKRQDPKYLEYLQNQYPEYLFVPEGGSNFAASFGLQELGSEITNQTRCNTIACAIGSGGTISGLMQALPEHQFIGVAVVNDEPLLRDLKVKFGNRIQIITSAMFGGYGKTKSELEQFCCEFVEQTHVPIEPIYTGKLFYALCEMELAMPEHTLAIHTGGLQGIRGLNYRRQCPPRLWQAVTSLLDV
jgi:1-aminocyclopropane-1-carboxylate deaminase